MYRCFLQFQYALKPILYLPITFLKRVLLGKDPYWKQYFFSKWGFPPKELAILVKNRKTIWIDVLGGGEVTQIVTFTKLLKDRYSDYIIVLSTNNVRPFKFAQRIEHIDFVFDTPWDLAFVVRKCLKNIRPKILIVIDQVRFPIILKEAKHMGIKTILISAALAPGYTQSDYMKRAIAFKFFEYFDLIGVTESRDKETYLKLGADPERLYVTGNMKYDADFLQLKQEEKEEIRKEIGVNNDDFVFVAGSVHVKEERLLLSGYQEAKKHIPNLKMLLVPRYLYHIGEMVETFRELEIPYVRRSQKEDMKTHPDSVMLVDTFGELSRLYAIASIMFIGNSIFPRDKFALGQNIIEPLIHAKPIFFGPHMNKWRIITNELKSIWEGLEINSAKDVAERIIFLHNNPALGERIEKKCLEILEQNKNGVWNNFKLVSNLLDQ